MISNFEDVMKEQGRLIFTNVGDSMMPLLQERKDLLIIEKKWLKFNRNG